MAGPLVWVDADAVAAHLNRSKKVVQHLARTGAIPAVKVGKHWSFLLEDIDAHLTRPADKWVQSPQSRGRKRVA